MALFPAPIVSAPTPPAVRYGLLTAANGPVGLSGKALGAGVRYEPDACGTGYVYPVQCDDLPTKTFDDVPDLVEADAFVVYAGLRCGAAGYDRAELERKVRARFAAAEQGLVERGLADAFTAAGPTALTAPDPSSFKSVVGELEQWLYGDQGYGYPGFIHAPFRFEPYAADAGLTTRDGTRLRSPLGTVWVFGNYPDDGTLTITGQVTVWRAEDVAVPDLDQTFDRTANQRYAIAEREYAVGWDCHAATVGFDPLLDVS